MGLPGVSIADKTELPKGYAQIVLVDVSDVSEVSAQFQE